MGLFDSDDVTSVYVNSIQLMPDPPDFQKKIALQAILSGQGIAESIMAAKPRIGLGLCKSVRQYALRQFAYGLPQFNYVVSNRSVINTSVTNTAALNQIKDILGDPSAITLTSVVYGPADDVDFIAKYVLSKNGWSPEYSAYNNSYMYQLATTRYNPNLPNRYFMWANRVIDYANPHTNTYNYRLTLGDNLSGGSPPVSYDSLSPRYELFHQLNLTYISQHPYIVKISYKDSNSSEPNRTRYWYYYPSSYQYPTINAGLTATGLFMPIIPIRENFAFLSDTSTLGKQSRKLLSKIGVSFADIENALLESGSIGDIRDAFVNFAIDALTTDSGLWPYLYEFFRKYADIGINSSYFNSDGTFKDSNAAARYAADRGNNIITSSSIDFNWTESNYSHSLRSSRILYTKTGTVGSSTTVSYTRELTIRPALGYVTLTTGISTTTDESSLKLVKRTGNQYETIYIFGLSSGNRIGSHNTPIAHMQDGVPMPMLMDTAIVQLCPAEFRDTIVYKAMNLHLNGYKVTHYRWYETNDFAQFIRFVGVAVTIFTLGTGAGLTAAIEAGLEATLIYVGETALTIAVISLAGKQIASWLGPEAAMVFAVIATVYGIADMGAGEISLPGAELALALVPAVQTGMQAELMKAFEELQFEADAMLKSNKDRMEELERAQSLLSDKGSLDPLFLIRAVPMFFTNESPTEFINRTIHNTNPGTSTLDSIRGYCRNQLILPKAETV